MMLEMAASCSKQAPEIVVPKRRMMNRANIPARWLQGSDLLGEGVVGSSWARDAMVGLEWEVQHVLQQVAAQNDEQSQRTAIP